jgi:hypothetical protein
MNGESKVATAAHHVDSALYTIEDRLMQLDNKSIELREAMFRLKEEMKEAQLERSRVARIHKTLTEIKAVMKGEK